MVAGRFFLGLRGRLGLGDFWLGAAALMALAWLATVAAWRLGLPKPFASRVGDLVMLAGAIGLCVKRGNDRGHAPAVVLAAMAMVMAGAALLTLAAAFDWPRPVTVALIAFVATLVVVLLVDLGLMQGTAAEPARAAPKTLAETVPDAVPTVAGLTLAAESR